MKDYSGNSEICSFVWMDSIVLKIIRTKILVGEWLEDFHSLYQALPDQLDTTPQVEILM